MVILKIIFYNFEFILIDMNFLKVDIKVRYHKSMLFVFCCPMTYLLTSLEMVFNINLPRNPIISYLICLEILLILVAVTLLLRNSFFLLLMSIYYVVSFYQLVKIVEHNYSFSKIIRHMMTNQHLLVC